MPDATHDPNARSWVTSAQGDDSGFPLQNLPHGVFRRRGRNETWRGGVAIGNFVLDLLAVSQTSALSRHPTLTQHALQAAAEPSLNHFMSLGRPAWRALRQALFEALDMRRSAPPSLPNCLIPQADIEMTLPAQVGDFTDFFTSHDHMRRMGALFQPGQPLIPAFPVLPMAYHGRASTVGVSPAQIRRPLAHVRRRDGGGTEVVPTRALDFELELGAWIGPGHGGRPLSVAEADERVFGLCLLNDWSARDMQGLEAVPLGPFLAKNFATTVSPWIVTAEALAPYRQPVRRDVDDPPLQPYLTPPAQHPDTAYALTLEAWLEPPGLPPRRLTHTQSAHSHWSFAQMLAHHSLNGCVLRPGDLLGSGTQSGPGPDECGCLMELTAGGREPLDLGNGQSRTQLADGDTMVLRGWASTPGRPRISLGECRGTVVPGVTA